MLPNSRRSLGRTRRRYSPSVLIYLAVFAVAGVGFSIPMFLAASQSPTTIVNSPTDNSAVSGDLVVSGSAQLEGGAKQIQVAIQNMDTDEFWTGDGWRTKPARFSVRVEPSGRWTYLVPSDELRPGRYLAKGFSQGDKRNNDDGDAVEFVVGQRLEQLVASTSTTLNEPRLGEALVVEVDETSSAALAEIAPGVEEPVSSVPTSSSTGGPVEVETAPETTSKSQAASNQTNRRSNAKKATTPSAAQIRSTERRAKQRQNQTASVVTTDQTSTEKATTSTRPRTVPTKPSSMKPTLTIEPPTTRTKITKPPTTEAPTTKPPTTKAPTTTRPPTTKTPTTKRPTTKVPTTKPPTTRAPTTTRPPTTKAPTTQPPTPGIVWEENFNSFNTSVWKKEHSTYGDGNNELQCYRPENVWVANGKLVLRALNESYTCPNGSTRRVTSGMVRTKGVTFRPGQALEFKVKLTPADHDNQGGLWPAVWASGWGGGGWPRGGELDFLEVMTAVDPKRTIKTLHYTKPNGQHGHTSNGGHYLSEYFSARWHTFRFDYGQDGVLVWYQDGQEVHRVTHVDTIQGYPDPFNKPITELKINLALGGSPGPLDTRALGTQGATYEIDYIRILNLG